MESMEDGTRASVMRGLVSRATTALLALAVSMGFLFLNAGSAAALNDGDLITTNFIRSWQTGRCLDSNASGQVYTLPCQQGNNYQTWKIIYRYTDGHDRVSIMNVATGLCLAAEPKDLYQANGHNIFTGDYLKYCGWARAWEGAGTSWDNVQLINGWCLDSNYAGDVYTTPCGDNDYQHWRVGY
ncbi:RICIN domain-containing protein [Streptomyces sp. NPDC002623]